MLLKKRKLFVALFANISTYKYLTKQKVENHPSLYAWEIKNQSPRIKPIAKKSPRTRIIILQIPQQASTPNSLTTHVALVSPFIHTVRSERA